MSEGFDVSNEEEIEREVPYLELIGSLGYAAKTSRPDIAFAFGYLSRYSHKVSKAAWEGAKRTLKYLKTTMSCGLHYARKDKNFELVGYSDASFNHDRDISTSGHVILLGNHPIHWRSKKQAIPSTSSCEAEIWVILEWVKDLIYIISHWNN